MTKSRAKIIAGVASLALAALAGCGGSSGTSTSAPSSPSVSSLSGSYVFSVSGTDATDGDYFVLGSFVADGKGGITSGVADYNLGSGIDANVPLTGTYTVSGSTATINLTDSKSVKDSFITTVGLSGSTPLAGFDGTGSGTLYPQTTSGFTPAGAYSFSVRGEGDGTVTGSGGFVASSGGTFSSGTLTYTDGATTKSYTTAPGFLAAPQANGRGQAALLGNDLAYYIISPSQILMVNLDQRALLMIPAQKS